MHFRGWTAAAVALVLAVSARGVSAADDATLLRVFLADGTSLVSYGEPARVGDRVVFSMPTAAMPNPPLHLVDLPISKVDWERTSRYAAAARAAHYVQTQADADYAQLSNEIAATLNDVARTADSAQRLVIVERARKALAEWPQGHFNYRLNDVHQMLAMLDEAIADLRAARGESRFDINLTAITDAPPNLEPLLPAPTPKEAIDQILGAAAIVESSAERTSLLASAVAAIDRDKAALPADWAASTRADLQAKIQAEVALDRSYQSLTKRMMTLANQRANKADVFGIERVLRAIAQGDTALGAKRPETVATLVAAVQSRLDAARRLQLARDRWAMREPAFRAYRVAMTEPMDLFAQLRPALESIRELSGSAPATLMRIQQTVTAIVQLISTVAPPEEMTSAHALLLSAVQLAGHAADIRREATLASNMSRAWDASSAAAGALMLGTKARNDIQALLRPPQLR
jgi:hypothetical protein